MRTKLAMLSLLAFYPMAFSCSGSDFGGATQSQANSTGTSTSTNTGGSNSPNGIVSGGPSGSTTVGTGTGTGGGLGSGTGTGTSGAIGNAFGTGPVTPQEITQVNSSNIDAKCAAQTPAAEANPADFVFPVKTTPANELAATCQNGFEVNNTPGTLTLTSAAGSQAVTLAVDFAAYQAPNFFRMQASGSWGQNTTVLDSCRLRTACYGDPSGGTCRPPEDSIRSFNVALPAGTTSVTMFFDDSSPYYVRVLGLCDFDLSKINTTLAGAARLVTGPTASTVCSASTQAGWPGLQQGVPSGNAALTCQ